MRKEKPVTGEHYHLYNRGVDKREIFMDKDDLKRFLQSMNEFNTVETIGSIYEKVYYQNENIEVELSKLVNFISYCLNPNHFHFVIEQIVDNGISRFMQKLSCGYTNYFNEKYKRSGSLFQGPFKAKHVSSNDYLLHVSAYVNLNNEVHGFGSLAPKDKIRSSWDEYMTGKTNFCKKDIVLDQFKTTKDYEVFARDALDLMIEKKKSDKEIQGMLLE